MRVANWSLALNAWANRAVGAEYFWGVTDCHALVVHAARVMYGHATPLRMVPLWESERAALRLIAEGWDLRQELVLAGAALLPLGFLQAGDVIVEPVSAEHAFPGALIALGADRFLTSNPVEGVRIVATADLMTGSACYRWPHG